MYKTSKKYRPWVAKPLDHKDNEYFVRCIWCETEILVDSLYGTGGHINNPAHLKKEEDHRKKAEAQEDHDSDINGVAKFEYDIICSLIIELNLPLGDIEPIIALFKKYSRAIAIRNSTLHRHNAADIIKQEISPYLKEKIEKDLQYTSFSIIIDESTDASNRKFLAIMLKY